LSGEKILQTFDTGANHQRADRIAARSAQWRREIEAAIAGKGADRDMDAAAIVHGLAVVRPVADVHANRLLSIHVPGGADDAAAIENKNTISIKSLADLPEQCVILAFMPKSHFDNAGGAD